MEPFDSLSGGVAPLNRVNVDTDQIIPKQFLKRVERTGFGQFLFNDWRFKEDGSENPDFILNKDKYKNATILVSGRNFGCGSSREHAPWALQDFGIRCIIAPSFADIFFANCFQNGILPVVLPEETVKRIIENSENESDLRSVSGVWVFCFHFLCAATGWSIRVRKRQLAEGLDFQTFFCFHISRLRTGVTNRTDLKGP